MHPTNDTPYIGILSDTHSNLPNLIAALTIFRDRRIDRLIHCGDVTRPDLLEEFQGFQVWLVRGNNDYDNLGLRSMARRLGNVTYCGVDAQLEFDGHHVAACHGDDESLLRNMSACGAYDWVFYGHSHRHELTTMGRTRVLNPGALGGRHPHGEDRCIAIVNLPLGTAEFISI